MKYRNTLILFFVCIAFNSLGQYVHPIKVIPANPTTADQVELIFHVSLGNQGFRLEHVTDFTGNNISVTSCYFYGMQTFPKQFYDTLRVGQLPIGAYQVSHVAFGGWGAQHCTPSTQASTNTTFIVSNTTGTKDDGEKGNLNIYPNPASGDFIMLAHQEPITEVTIYSITGTELKTYKNPEGENQMNLNIQELPKGIYLLLTETNGEFSWNRFIRN